MSGIPEFKKIFYALSCTALIKLPAVSPTELVGDAPLCPYVVGGFIA
jgi:hypothetical protein